MEFDTVAAVLPHPRAPLTLGEAGLPLDLVVQLVLKTLNFAGDQSGHDLGRRLGLRFTAVEPALDLLRAQHHVDVAGGSMMGPSAYRYRITDSGRDRALLFMEQNPYVGFAPVPLSQYARYMQTYEIARPRAVMREHVRRAYSHLVLSDRVIDQLGPAVNAGHSLFVYGPPGNGKTLIAQGLRNLLGGDLAIPHALEVEGHIIRVYDPVVHQSVDTERTESGLDEGSGDDLRWVRCRRPVVTVGGELTLEALDLSPLSAAGYARAPLQALANGGVFVIDDFGRQRCSPRDLLNRWIVPLESRVDYLTLQTGQKFEMPFTVLVAFATNIRPRDLVDEAFLRRIHHKVFAESPSPRDFALIFRNCCEQRGIAFDPALVDRLFQEVLRPRRVALRACQPRDLIDQALSLADYLNEPRGLTFELLQSACDGYFIDDGEE